MSNTAYPFAILRVHADALRGERMNVGLAIFTPNGVRLFIEADKSRLAFLNPDLRAVPWDDLAAHGEEMLSTLHDIELLKHAIPAFLAPLVMDEQLGEIVMEDGEDIAERADELLTRLVRRPVSTFRVKRATSEHRASRLNATLRDWFKQAKLLSRNAADLPKHKVVSNYPISASSDLYAEFALKNGEVHVIETVDFRRHEKVTESVRKEAAIKSIILDQAKEVFGKKGKRIAVLAADDYGVMRSVVRLVTSYADDVITLESSADRQRLTDFIQKSLHTQQQIPVLNFE